MGATSVVVSTQHVEDLEQAEIKRMLWPIVKSTLPKGWMCPEAEFHVNPTGKFVIGGPDGDCGLTGRKIIVDTYGGAAPHGGGAFSGKDPTKVDRSAAYACRYLAKNVVAAGLADRCTIQISYAIGISRPLSVYVDLQGTGKDVDETRLEKTLRELMNLTPRGIREHLHLNRPIYVPTSAYGHFGREPDEEKGTFTWERDRPGAGAEVSLRALKPPPDRLYGRARGHKLRPRQQRLLDVTLPRLAFAPEQAADPLAAFSPRPGRALAGSGLRRRRARAGADRGASRHRPDRLRGVRQRHLLAAVAPGAGGRRGDGAAAGQPAPVDRRRAGAAAAAAGCAASIGCSCCSPIPGRRRGTPSAASCIRRCCRCWRGC